MELAKREVANHYLVALESWMADAVMGKLAAA